MVEGLIDKPPELLFVGAVFPPQLASNVVGNRAIKSRVRNVLVMRLYTVNEYVTYYSVIAGIKLGICWVLHEILTTYWAGNSLSS